MWRNSYTYIDFPYWYIDMYVDVFMYVKNLLKRFVLVIFHTLIGPEHPCRNSYSTY